MEVTDSNPAEASKTKGALSFLSTVFFIEAGFMVVGWVVPTLLGRFSSGAFDAWFKVQSLVWLGLSVALLIPVWTLKSVLKEQLELVTIVLGTGVLGLGFELFSIYLSFTRELGQPRDHHTVISLLSVAVGATMALCLLVLVGRLGKLVPFAAGIGAFVLVRALTTVALFVRDTSEMPPMWIYGVRTFLSIGISVASAVLCLQAARSLTAEKNVLNSGPLAPPIAEASGMRLVFAGVALLVLGIGGTAMSYSLASDGGGGRYFIATGAIATGLVQLVRGLTRIGRGS